MERTDNLLGAVSILLSDAILERASRTAGRSGAAGAALATLGQEPGQGIERLRQPLALTQSAAVRVVNGLVADGLAVRGPGVDGRSVSVVLTPQGSALAAAVLAERAEVLQRATSVLSVQERQTLTALMEKMLTELTRDRAHAERICRLCDYGACPQEICPVEQAGQGCATEPSSPSGLGSP